MILESLLELVETLKADIDEHGDKLRQSEWITRYALIDPLLRELGWDTEDPSLVIPEYQSGHRRADYALLGDGKPLIMLEAKKLGTPLRDSVLSQGIQYCLEEGTKHFSVTDGQSWEVYETHRPVPIEQKRVVEFDIKNQEAAEVCLKALALWKPSVQAGYVAAAQQSVIAPPEVSPALPQPPVTNDPSIPPDDGHEWHLLTRIPTATGQKPPVELRFPDGSSAQTQYWYSLTVEAIRWLKGKEILGANNCPIMMGDNPRATRYVVHTQPVHRNGVRFTRSIEVNGLYVEVDGSQPELISWTKYLIGQVGQDPAQFSVRFS